MLCVYFKFDVPAKFVNMAVSGRLVYFDAKSTLLKEYIFFVTVILLCEIL